MLMAVFWSLVGLGLVSRGSFLLITAGSFSWIVFGLLIGACKSFFILDRVARKNIKRIRGFSGGVFLGAVFSAAAWLLVAGMCLIGILIRLIGFPDAVMGCILVSVGVGLIFSSRYAWRAWDGERRSHHF